MVSPLASENLTSENRRNHTKRSELLLYTYLVALAVVFALFCTAAVRGAESQAAEPKATASCGFFPQSLAQQLQRIVDSPAAEVQPLREVCAAILDDLNNIVAHIEHNPAELPLALERLERSIRRLEARQVFWAATPSVNPNAREYIPSAIALDEVTLALQRRIFVWRAFLQTKTAEGTPITTLYEKSFADLNRLRERTLAAGQYFARSRQVVNRQTGQTWEDYLGTRSWLTELEAFRQPHAQPIRRVSLSHPYLPIEVLQALGSRANMTMLRLESPHLTHEQRVFLNHPAVHAWRAELQNWAVDIVAPIDALRYLERYETTGGMSDMRAFSRSIEQLSMSRTPEYRQFGDNLRRQYGMANVQFFISSALLNNHLPPPASETALFREVIQSQPTIGQRQTDSVFVVSFVPHPTRILTSLEVGVDLTTFSRSDAFATRLFNTGQTLVVARKMIELTQDGFVTEPSEAQIIDHRMGLSRMDTNFDRMPILSGLFRNTVRNQYENRFSAATMETQHRILQEVRAQVDREATQRLRPLNEQIRTLSRHADQEFGLRIEKRKSRTEEHWLLTSWGVRGHDSLLGSTPPPETLPGAFADLKIHESLPNSLLGSLEFEGRRGTVGEFKEVLAEKFRMPALAEPEEHDDVEVTFAPHNPMVVRFVDGRVELTISIAALRILRNTTRDFQVIVRYKPGYDSEGRPVLERCGYISLINVREQILMRAVFGRIFPVSRPFTLVPRMLDEDPQFYYLTTGHCRIENGWFALALLEKEEYAVQRLPNTF